MSHDRRVADQGGTSKYRMTLSELERSARVDPVDQVESVEADEVAPLDVAGPQPDARWFAAGG